MSHPMISRSCDLKKLRDEGYALSILEGCLVVDDIPFAKEGVIERGSIVCSLETDGERTGVPGDHTVFWTGIRPDAGEMSLRSDGVCGIFDPPQMMAGKAVGFQLSIKPQGGSYGDYYQKITAYADFLSRGAKKIDAEADPRRYKIVEELEDDSKFVYRDGTAEVRGVNALNRRLESERVAIIGVGGTGSYILDYVARTPVEEIHVYDGDRMKAHNGYRIPGTIGINELRERPFKADWLGEQYSKLRRQVFGHTEDVFPPLPDAVANSTFVFMSIDDPSAKREIIPELLKSKIPFVHVGISVEVYRDETGNVMAQPGMTTTLIAPEDHWTMDELRQRINLGPLAGEDQQLYGRNVQMAELNAMNAAFAVIQWKKYRGVYRDELGLRDSIYDAGLQVLTKRGVKNAT